MMLRNMSLATLAAFALSACDDAHLRFDVVARFNEDAAVDAALAIDSGEVLADASPIDARAADANDNGGDIDAEVTVDLGNADSGVDALVPPDGCVATGAEVCDGVDNDCDGVIDESSTDPRQYVPRYRDVDGDGHGAANRDAVAGYEFCDFRPAETPQCPLAEGFSDDALDCNDRDAAISPSDVEICDGIDNDCDGLIDEGSSLCAAGSACESGSRACVACAEFTTLPTVIEEPTVICANSGVISVPTTSVILPASEGGSLTIEAGNTLAFANDTELFVRADLHVRGTTESPVVFRSAAATPTASSWKGIRLDPAQSTTIHLVGFEGAHMGLGIYEPTNTGLTGDFGVFDSTFHDNARVFYVNHPLLNVLRSAFRDNGMVVLQTVRMHAGLSVFEGNETIGDNAPTDVVFADSEFRDNRTIGAFHLIMRACRSLFEGNDVITPPSGPSPRTGGRISECTFVRNGGALIGQNEELLIENSTLCDNAPYDIVVTTTRNVEARNNYWCTSDLDDVRARVYDIFDDATLGRVQFDPILTSPHPDAPVPTPLP
jgi:hypothetical protein